jgi:hypothetical protein
MEKDDTEPDHGDLGVDVEGAGEAESPQATITQRSSHGRDLGVTERFPPPEDDESGQSPCERQRRDEEKRQLGSPGLREGR